MFAVAGVSGRTGAVVAQQLLAQGQQVRVIVRDAARAQAWKQQGAEVAVADLGDEQALTRALSGVEGAYLLSPPNFAAADFIADRRHLVDTMARAVKAAKLKNLVFLSSIGAQLSSGTGPIVTVHHAEQVFRGIAPSVTFVRAAYFIENWGSVVGLAKAQGVLPHYGPVDVKFAQICAADIGAVAARALRAPADGTQIIELASREDWSVQDVAAALGARFGAKVNAVAAPVEHAFEGLKQAGLPPTMAALYAEMYAGFAQGRIQWERPAALTRGTSTLEQALAPLVG